MKYKKIFKVVMRLFFALTFIAIIVVASFKQNELVCNKIEVNIKDKNDLKFISEKDVLSMINTEENTILINKKISKLELKNLEQKLENDQYIDNVEVYSNFDGIIKIDIVQKKPLYRVVNNKNVSYYISNKSFKVPLSSNFTPRLIMATGYIPNKEINSKNLVNWQLDELIKYIKSDAFWDAMITQVEVKKNGDFVLIPKIRGHTVLLGTTEDLEAKFSKLKIFYQKGLKKIDWKKYKEINLKYKGQLICSK